jgi:hypothetical protein
MAHCNSFGPVHVHVGCPEQWLCTPFNLLEVVLWVRSKDTMFSWARWEKNCICGMSNQEYQTASLGSPWMILSCLFCLMIFTFFCSWNGFHSVSLHLEGTHLNLQTTEDVQVSSLCAAHVCQPVNNWYTWHSLCSIDHPMQNWRHEEFEHSLLDQYHHSLMVLTQMRMENHWRICLNMIPQCRLRYQFFNGLKLSIDTLLSENTCDTYA